MCIYMYAIYLVEVSEKMLGNYASSLEILLYASMTFHTILMSNIKSGAALKRDNSGMKV